MQTILRDFAAEAESAAASDGEVARAIKGTATAPDWVRNVRRVTWGGFIRKRLAIRLEFRNEVELRQSQRFWGPGAAIELQIANCRLQIGNRKFQIGNWKLKIWRGGAADFGGGGL